MKGLLKRIIATLLIASMLLSSQGVATFASSIEDIVQSYIAKNEDEQKRVRSYKYYEEFKLEKKSYLLNDSNGSENETMTNTIETTIDENIDGSYNSSSQSDIKKKEVVIDEPEEGDDNESQSFDEEEESNTMESSGEVEDSSETIETSLETIKSNEETTNSIEQTENVDDNDDVSTISELEVDEATISEVIEEEVATASEAEEEVATVSDLEEVMATTSEVEEVATISEMIEIATASRMTGVKVASEGELFGDYTKEYILAPGWTDCISGYLVTNPNWIVILKTNDITAYHIYHLISPPASAGGIPGSNGLEIYEKVAPGAEGRYIYIRADAGSRIKLPADCKYLFSHSSFRDVWHINGLEKLDWTEVEDASYMFYGLESLDLGWQESSIFSNSINLKSTAHMFDGCKKLAFSELTGGISLTNCPNIEDTSYMYNDCVSKKWMKMTDLPFNSEKVITMEGMFRNNTAIKEVIGGPITVSGSDAVWPNLVNTSHMFENCSALEKIEWSSTFRVRHALETQEAMYKGCASLTTYDPLLESPFAIRGKNVDSMFEGCSGITSINFQTRSYTCETKSAKAMFKLCSSLSEVTFSPYYDNDFMPTDVSSMFEGCKSLKRVSWGKQFNTQDVVNMSCMFKDCRDPELNLNLSSFNVEKVEDMSYMFSHFAFDSEHGGELDLSSFKTTALKKMDGMFEYTKLRTIYATEDFDISNVVPGLNSNPGSVEYPALVSRVFFDAGNLVGGRGSVVNLHDTTTAEYTYAHIDGGLANPGYFTNGNEYILPKDWYDPVDSVKSRDTIKNIVFQTVTEPTGTFVYEDNIPNSQGLRLYVSDDTAYVFGAKNCIIKLGLAGDATAAFGHKDNNIENKCFNSLISFTGFDKLDTSETVNMSNLFEGCGITSFGEQITFTNLQNVTNMSRMFKNCAKLENVDLGSLTLLDLDKLTTTEEMFAFAGKDSDTNLNVTIRVSNKKTPALSNVNGMFKDANVKLITLYSFDTSNVLDFTSMFEQNISKDLDTKVTLHNCDLNLSKAITVEKMFKNANVLIGDGDNDFKPITTNALINMDEMFYHDNIYPPTHYAEIDLSNMVFDSVISMSNVFNGRSNLTKVKLPSTINTSSARTMEGMFANCVGLTSIENLNYLNISSVDDLSNMFKNDMSLTKLNLGAWTAHKDYVKTDNMFNGCSSLRTIYVRAEAWTNEKIQSSINMFAGCVNLVGGQGTKVSDVKIYDATYAWVDGEFTNKKDIKEVKNHGYFTDNSYYIFAPGWDNNEQFKSYIPNVEKISISDIRPSQYDVTWEIFGSNGLIAYYNDAMKEVTIYADDSSRNIYSASDCSHLFSSTDVNGYVRVKDLNITLLNTIKTCNMSNMFYGMGANNAVGFKPDLSNFVTASVSDMSNMFSTTGFTELDLSNFSSKSLTNMNGMFFWNEKLTSVVFDNTFDAKKVENFSMLAFSCENLTTFDVSNFEPVETTNVDMSYMFYGCNKLTTIDFKVNATSKVVNMSGMFQGCSGLTSFNITNFDTSNVTDMSAMFYGCNNITRFNFDSFDTSNVTDMTSMFRDCSSIKELNLGSFKTNNVVEMKNMFAGCDDLVTIYAKTASFVHNASLIGTDMFNNCVKLVGGQGTKYNSANRDHDYAYVDGDGGNAGYFTDADSYLLPKTWFKEASLNKSNVTSIIISSEAADKVGTAFDIENSNGLVGYQNGNRIIIYALNASATIYADTDSSELFKDFNNVTTITNLNRLNTVKTGNMSYMFANMDKAENINLLSFDTKNVSTMSYMFYNTGSTASNKPTFDLSSFNSESLVNMVHMFDNSGATSIVFGDSFTTAKVESYEAVFKNCRELNVAIDLNKFDSSKVTNMKSMFAFCTNLPSIAISRFNTSKVIDMTDMFLNCESVTTLDLREFDTSNVTIMLHMFNGCKKLTTIYATSDFTANKLIDKDSVMFDGCTNLMGGNGTRYAYLEASNRDKAWWAWVDGIVGNIQDPTQPSSRGYFTDAGGYTIAMGFLDNMTGKNYNDIATIKFVPYGEALDFTTNQFTVIDTTSPTVDTLKGYWQNNIDDSTKIDILIRPEEAKNIYTAIDASYLFSNIDINKKWNNLKMINGLSNIKTARSTNMSHMFDSIVAKTIDVSALNTRNVETMSYMFYNCADLTELNLDTFDTLNTIDMSHMFDGCSSLKKLRVNKFDTRNVTDMSYMFNGLSSLTDLQVSLFNTEQVTNMSHTFAGMNNDKFTRLSIINFNTNAVTDMTSMFDGDTNLKTIYASYDFVTTAVISGNDANMFEGCSKLIGGNGTKWSDKQTSDAANYKNKKYAKVDNLTQEGYFTNSFDPTKPYMYVIGPDWYDGINDISDITKITIQKGGIKPIGTEFVLKTGNGLLGYENDAKEVIIWAEHGSTDVPIYTEIDSTGLLQGFSALKKVVNIDELDTKRTTNMSCLFDGDVSLNSLGSPDLSKWDLSKLTNTYAMFRGTNGLDYINLSSFDITEVTNMASMFEGSDLSRGIILNSNTFKTDKVVSMEAMFKNTNAKVIDLSNFDSTKLENVKSMFEGSKAITSITFGKGFKLNGSYNIDMSFMFKGLEKLEKFNYADYSSPKAMNDLPFNLVNATMVNMEGLFDGCKALKKINGLYKMDTKNVSNMSYMFNGLETLEELDVSYFNTAKVTNMSHMFAGASKLKELSLVSFDTANVTDMTEMFGGCSNITTIYASTKFVTTSTGTYTDMFKNCSTKLKGGNGTIWNSSALDRKYAWIDGVNGNPITGDNKGYFSKYSYVLAPTWFDNAIDASEKSIGRAFGGVTKITILKAPKTVPTGYVSQFGIADSNGLIGYYYNTGEIVVYAPSDMDIYTAVDSSDLFSQFMDVTEIEGLNLLNTSKTTSMRSMFYGLMSLSKLDISTFDTSNVTDMMGMFSALNTIESLDLSNLDTKNVIDMSFMFRGNANLKTIDISNFDTHNTTKMQHMFAGAGALTTIYVSDSFTAKGANTTSMFADCDLLDGGAGTTYAKMKVQDPNNYQNGKYAQIDGLNNNKGYFCGRNYVLKPGWYIGTYTAKKDINEIVFAKETDATPSAPDEVFDIPNSNGLIGYVKGAEVTIYAPQNRLIYAATNSEMLFGGNSVSDSFENLSNIKNIKYLNTSNVINMNDMFAYCSHLTSLDLSSFNTSKVTSMASMFKSMSAIASLNLNSFDTSRVKTMAYMFYDMQELVGLNLTNFRTASVSSMERMFGETRKLERVDVLSGFDTKNVTTMEGMFTHCEKLATPPVVKFNTSKVTNMSNMFSYMTSMKEVDLSRFNTKNVKDTSHMFEGCSNLVSIYASEYFVRDSITNSNSMFLDCNSIKGGGTILSTTYDSSKTNWTYAWIDGEPGNDKDGNSSKGYFTGKYSIMYAHIIGNGGKIWNNGELVDEVTIPMLLNQSTAQIRQASRYERAGFMYNGLLLGSPTGAPISDNWNYTNKIVDLYVDWTANTFAIRYYKNSNTAYGLMATDSNVAGNDYIIKNNAFKNDGYSFKWWDRKGYNATYSEAEIVTGGWTNDVNLYAVWGAKTFNVIYDGNGATSGNTPNQYNLEYGKDHQLNKNGFVKTGYTFNGWAYATDNCVVKFENTNGEAGWILADEPYQAEIKYYAVWIKNTDINSTLILDANGGYINGTTGKIKIYGTKGELVSQVSAYRKGHMFEYWSKDTQKGVRYTYPHRFDFESLTLVANWKTENYKIHYHANDGTNLIKLSPELAYTQNYNILPASTFSRENYIFKGWSYDSKGNIKAFDGSESVVGSDLIGAADGRVDLYAIWEGMTFTITYKNWDPITVPHDRTVTYQYGNNQRLLPISSASCIIDGNLYVFKHWNSGKYADAELVDSVYNKEKKKNIELTANWILADEAIYIVFDGNGGLIDGNSAMVKVYQKGDRVSYPADCGAKVYRKAYSQNVSIPWLKEDRTTPYNDLYVNYEPGTTILVYANWVSGKYNISYEGVYDDVIGTTSNQYDLECDAASTLNKNGFERIGYDFKGWDIDSQAQQVIFVDGAEIPAGFADVNETIHLYAVWVEKEYRIEYYSYENKKVGTDQIAVYNRNIRIRNNTPIPEGVSDKGFVYKYIMNGTEMKKSFNSGETVKFNVKTFASMSDIMRLYGTISNEVYVTFNKSTPISPDHLFTNAVLGEMLPRKFESNEKLSKNVYEVFGYTFIGWATASHTAREAEELRDISSDLIIADCAEAGVLGGVPGSNITLYALWTRNKVNLRLIQNESKCNVPDPYATTDGYVLYDSLLSENSAFASRTREGYTFSGKFSKVRIDNPYDRAQYNANAIEGTYFSLGSICRTTGVLELYPVWLNNEVTITMELGNGYMPEAYTQKTFIGYVDAPYFIKGPINEPKLASGELVSPIASDSTLEVFDAWCEDEACTKKIDADTIYTGVNTKIFANYRERTKYTYRFFSSDKKEEELTMMAREGIAFTLPDVPFKAPDSKSYFYEWFDQYIRKYYNEQVIEYPNEDLDFYAVWYKDGGGSNGGGGGGGGGGHGVGNAGSNGNTKMVAKYIVQTPIKESDCEWIYDKEGKKESISVSVNNEVAKALMSSKLTESMWSYLDDGRIRLQGEGIYCIEYYDKPFYFAFNNDGKLVLGFVEVRDESKILNIENGTVAGFTGSSVSSDGIFRVENANHGKFYFYDKNDVDIYRGILWDMPIEVDGLTYYFDSLGRVIAIYRNGVGLGSWEYYPNEDVWRCKSVDMYGQIQYYKSGVYEILSDGAINKYIFDDNGNMLVGRHEIDGVVYQTQLDGQFKGAVISNS